MTPAEVRAVVERVVAEHGQGWSVWDSHGRRLVVNAPRTSLICIVVDGPGSVWPSFELLSGDASCARAVALWPEMQRLVSMLREALFPGPKEAP